MLAPRKRPPSALSEPALRLIARAYLKRLGEEHRAERVRVAFNPRLRSSIGRSEPARARIYLNPRLIDLYPDELVPTLVHELCHVVAGIRAGHGPRWRALMERCGFAPDTYHDLDLPAELLRRRHWRWRCRTCGFAYVRQTRSARHYRCGRCGGALRVTGEVRVRDSRRGRRHRRRR